jgi:hypothetical protein
MNRSEVRLQALLRQRELMAHSRTEIILLCLCGTALIFSGTNETLKSKTFSAVMPDRAITWK